MSKYEPLWKWIAENGGERFTLSHAEIGELPGFPIDHSFLNCKRELLAYGWQVGKISLKEQTVAFEKLLETKRRNNRNLHFFLEPTGSIS